MNVESGAALVLSFFDGLAPNGSANSLFLCACVLR